MKQGEASAMRMPDGEDGRMPGDEDATMTATLLDGERLAAKIRAEVNDRVARLADAGVGVGLGTILVGRRRTERPLCRHEARRLRRGRHPLGP